MLLCTPSDSATARLQSENASGTIVQTGDVARDVLVRLVAQAPALEALDWWPIDPGAPFVFATLHRAELTASAELVRQAIDALGRLDVPVILPAHPRLRLALRDFGLTPHLGGSIHVLEPLGYLEAVACLRAASLVVTDSGGIQREAYWLGIPCVTLRSETEWTETVALGANTLVAPDSIGATLASVVRPLLHKNHDPPGWNRDAYGTGYAAQRIGEAIKRFAEVF
jgi:UDP-N-acetylglucosamine 2-epimerase